MKKVNIVEKFLTKENIIIISLMFYALLQSNVFATKLDLAELRNEVLQQKIELQQYSDSNDKELQQSIDAKFQIISNKLDRLK